MGFETYMQFLYSQLDTLFSNYIQLFTGMGLTLFRGFATILLVWAGVKIALSSASGNVHSFDFSRIAGLILTIAFGYSMITYYASPIPGIGYSFHDLITEQTKTLAHAIGTGTSESLFDKLNAILDQSYRDQAQLSIFRIQELLAWVSILIFVGLLEFVVFAVIAFGYIAAAVLGIVGPIFIPFFIVPKMDFLFWGWFKSFMQYAFYPVIANAFILVVAQILLHFLNLLPGATDNFSQLADAWATLPFTLILLAAGIWGILRIPSLVNHLFSGSSGEGGGAMISTALAAVRGAF